MSADDRQDLRAFIVENHRHKLRGLCGLLEGWAEGVTSVIGDAGPAVDVETVGKFIAHGRWLMELLEQTVTSHPDVFKRLKGPAPYSPGRIKMGLTFAAMGDLVAELAAELEVGEADERP